MHINSCGAARGEGQIVFVVITILLPRLANLAMAVHTLDSLRLQFCLCECGQEHGRQDRDDGDHDEKFD